MSKKFHLKVLVLALGLLTVSGMAQAAFTTKMTARQVSTEISTQLASGASLEEIAQAAKGVGLNPAIVTKFLIQAGQPAEEVVNAVIAVTPTAAKSVNTMAASISPEFQAEPIAVAEQPPAQAETKVKAKAKVSTASAVVKAPARNKESATPAIAGDLSKLSVGAGYGFGNGGVFSVRGDYDIADLANNKPIKVRVSYEHYSIDTGGLYTWSFDVFYAGVYYDFRKDLNLADKLHPFAGLGFGIGAASCSGTWCNGVTAPTFGGLDFLLGLQYDVTPKIAAEANINGWGGLSLGANFKF